MRMKALLAALLLTACMASADSSIGGTFSALGQTHGNNFTTTLATPTNTPLSFQLSANSKYIVEGVLTTTCSSPTGLKLAFTGPAGTTVTGWVYATLNVTTVIMRSYVTALNTLTPSMNTATTPTPAPVHFWLVVQTSATPGNIMVQVASAVAPNTSTVVAGSWWRLRDATTV